MFSDNQSYLARGLVAHSRLCAFVFPAPTIQNAILSSLCLSKFYVLNMCPAMVPSLPGPQRVGSIHHAHPQTFTEPFLGLGGDMGK